MDKFEITKLHGDIVKVSYDLEIVNLEAKKNIKQFVETSEKIYKSQIEEIICQICEKNFKIVFVSGPSSAGKTTSSELIAKGLNQKNIGCIAISMDDFFLSKKHTPLLPNGEYDNENVTALDIPYFNNFIKEILKNGKALLPRFNFLTGNRSGYEEIVLKKNDVLIVEGLHALNPIFAEKEKIFRVYVAVNSNFIIGKEIVISCKQVRLMRRLLRDYYNRGNSIEETLNAWKYVCMGEDKFVIPFRNSADYIINTVHMYEPLLYDTYLKPLLKKVKNNEQAEKLLKVFDKTGQLNREVIPETSLLWEFVPKDL
ncbi:MAG: nucleoside kinase [Clostridia bacterium]|nr:nucleoside kinase [Clostridia bacterium]